MFRHIVKASLIGALLGSAGLMSAPAHADLHWETCELQSFKLLNRRISIECKGTSKPYFSMPITGEGATDGAAYISLLMALKVQGKPFPIQFWGGVESPDKTIWQRRPVGCSETDCFRLNAIEVK